MDRRIKHTELWEVRPSGERFLVNTIKIGSKFHNFKVPDNMETAESQMQVARSLKLGWDMNGPYRGIYKYEIVQVWQ